MTTPTIQIEVMLLSWSQTHNGGSKIVLQLADEDDLAHFQQMTVRKGTRAGQRLIAVFVEIGDDEKPVIHSDQIIEPQGQPETPAAPTAKPAKGPHWPAGLCGLATRWCADPAIVDDFLEWLWAEHGGECYAVNEGLSDAAMPSDLAAGVIRAVCGITSRRDLDTDQRARGVFDDRIRLPYSAHRRARGLE